MSQRSYIDNKIGAFVDHIDDRFDAVFEILDTLLNQTSKLPTMQHDITELKSDMKVVKHSLKKTNKEMHELATSTNRRLLRLETAA